MYGRLGIIILAITLLGATGAAAEEATREQIKGLDEQVQEIKADVLGIAAELNQLEEKLLYPSDTQVAVFVALAEEDKFRLDSVELQLDRKIVATHLYTFKELEALQAGGVQRLYTGNLTTGGHPLQVTLTGKSAGGREILRTGTFTVNKAVGPKIVELTLADPGLTGEAMTFKEW